MSDAKWYLRTQDETFGPETQAKLVEWARLGRIQPGQEVSEDNISWTRVEDVAFLDMRFSIDLGDGNPRGPFNRAAAEALLASGRLPRTASLVETRAPFDVETVEAVENVETVEKVVEVPVEKIVEKVVEVPVEKVIEVLPPPDDSEPEPGEPPPKIADLRLGGLDRARLAALEKAARLELMRGRRMGMHGNLFERR